MCQRFKGKQLPHNIKPPTHFQSWFGVTYFPIEQLREEISFSFIAGVTELTNHINNSAASCNS